MKTPALKKLMETFGIDRETAALIKKVGKAHTEGREALQKLVEEHPKLEETAKYARSCYNSPWTHSGWRTTMALHAINALVGAYGVEALRPDSDSSTSWPPFEYLNMGDTYATTLVYSRRNGADNLFIGSWGGVVEGLGW